MTAQIEVSKETAVKLQAMADALQLSLDEYLSWMADLVAPPPTNGQEKTAELTPFELVEDLIGSVDSSLSDDISVAACSGVLWSSSIKAEAGLRPSALAYSK